MSPNVAANHIYLGIDPGIADMGFGVVVVEAGKERCLEYGSLKTAAGTPVGERLRTIHDGLSAIIRKYRPTTVGLEKLYFQKNVKTAMNVAEARGVILLCLAQHGLKVMEFNPSDIKIAVCGYGLADKSQVQRMVVTLLGLKEIPKPDDAADALAVALTAAHSVTFSG